MKVQILQENLHKALMLVDRFVSSKSQLPVLLNLLFEAKKEGFFITATNLETGIRMRVGSKIDEEGAMTVPAKIFGEFVGTLPTETVTLSMLEGQLLVECGNYKASFQGIAASEYPNFPQKMEGTEQKLQTTVLKRVVDKVGFSASADDTRPVLMGMLWDVGKRDSKVVSTDGYRLSLLRLPSVSIGEMDKSLLLPAFVLREVVRVFGDLGVNEVSFSWSEKEKQVFYYSDDVEIVTRVLDGEFPNYQAVIPQDQTLKATLPKQELIQAVKMAAIFARESANIIRWKFSDGKLQISANSPQVGTNSAIVTYDGEGFEEKEIAFNSRYLLDACGHVDGDEVVFSMTETLRPGVFFDKKEDSDFVHVIMPVRVQG